MLQTSWPHPRRDLPSPEEVVLPAIRNHVPVHSLRQDGAVGFSETYYAYHLGRAVQRHHHRLWVGLCVVPPVLGSGSLQEPTGAAQAGARSA
jgi:hypothetical protein